MNWPRRDAALVPPPPPQPTNYAGHDPEYARRRAAGQPGWDPADVIAENLALLDTVFAAPHVPRQGRLLELGCGAGDWSLWAAARGFQVIGLDIAPTAVQWATEKAAARGLDGVARFEQGAVTDLGRFADAAFDIVLDGHCLHCIIGPDRAAMLSEASRVLRPGGMLHVNSMCGDPSPEFASAFDPQSRCLIYRNTASRYIGRPESIAAEVAAVGLSVVAQRILPRRTSHEFDLLVLDAIKPA